MTRIVVVVNKIQPQYQIKGRQHQLLTSMQGEFVNHPMEDNVFGLRIVRNYLHLPNLRRWGKWQTVELYCTT